MNLNAFILIFVFVEFLPEALAYCNIWTGRENYKCRYFSYSKSRHTKSCGWWSRCAYYRKSTQTHYKWCYRICRVNGNWRSWSSWSQYSGCNRSCGYGRKTYVRKRYCNYPSPRNGGSYCYGSSRSYKSVSCYRKPCPVNGHWGSWYSWSSYSGCNKSCGYGTRTMYRKRYCNNPSPRYGGRSCSGSSRTYKYVRCYGTRCPVNGRYSNWGSWGSCSKHCGGGTKYRYRYCTNPRPKYGGRKCSGSNYRYTSCNNHKCPVNGHWGSWYSWSSYSGCNKSCGYGTRKMYRYRYCNNPSPRYGGRSCSGSSRSYRYVRCYGTRCPVHGGYSNWGSWGSCSKHCGGGTKYRNRYCTNPRPKYGGRKCSGSNYRYTSCNNHKCPINGQWGSWYSWSSYSGCNKSCGYGTRTMYRNRYCNKPSPRYGGRSCRGSSRSYKYVRCFQKYCPVNGHWSSWYSWSQYSGCNKSCGYGTKTMYRKRYCNNPSPRYGGRSCSGSSRTYKSVQCFRKYCPVHGGYTSWATWNSCNKICGGGTKYRYRYCSNPRPKYGGRKCTGSYKQFTSCNIHKCPVHGGYTSWADWNPCTKSCGGGTKTRYRYCTSPRPMHGGRKCKGISYQYKTCNNQKCPVHGGYTSWGVWSSCNKSCGGGTRTRYRSCTKPKPQYGGKTCKGLSYQNTSCNNQKCPVNGGYTTWGSWSVCNKSCDGGTKRRYRYCTNPTPKYGGKNCVGTSNQYITCNKHNCPVDGNWTTFGPFIEWTSCNVTCGGGITSRQLIRSCTNPSPAFGGKPCSGKSIKIERKQCNKNPCPIDGNWTQFGQFTEWSLCNVTCGGGRMSRTRFRNCTNPQPTHGGKSCNGSEINTESKSCNSNHCPVNGNWTSFGSFTEWTSCNVTCGGGITSRQQNRSCTNPTPAYGGNSCSGGSVKIERKTCNNQPCPIDGKWTQFGQFTEWTPCNVTCGGGTMSRKQFRNCSNPEPVYGGEGCSGSGINTETKSCNSWLCPGYKQLTSTSAPNIENTTMISGEKNPLTTAETPIKKTMVTTLMTPVSSTTTDATYENGYLGGKSNISGTYKTTAPKNFHDINEITTPVQESTPKVDIQTEMDEENIQGNKSSETEDTNNGFVLTTKQSPPDITTEQTIDSGFNASSTKAKVETTTALPENLPVVSTPKPYGLTTVVYEKEYKSDKDNTRGNLTIVMNNNTFSYNTSKVETITTAEDNEKKPEESATQSAIILPNNESGEVNLKTTTDSQQKTSLLTITSSTTLPTNMVTNLSLDSSNVTSSQEKSNASNNKITGETNIVTTLYNNSNFNNQTCKNLEVNQSDIAFTSSEYIGRNFSSIFSSEGIVLMPVNGTTLLNVIFASPLNISSLEAILINHEKVNVTLYDSVGKIIEEKVTEHNNYTAVISKIQISIFVHDPEEEISVLELRAVACVD